MKQFNSSLIAVAACLVFSSGAMAQAMSKDEYKAAKDKVSADYKAAAAACSSMSGNAKDICKVEATGKEKVAKAELEDSYEPSPKHHYAVRIAKAEADYSLAKEKCDDQAGNAKDVCVKEAKAAQVAAKADAKVQMTTTDANSTAYSKVKDAKSDASADKVDAQYKVEVEKCDSLAGAAKDTCVQKAKTRFGK
jgi:hypothetical protein